MVELEKNRRSRRRRQSGTNSLPKAEITPQPVFPIDLQDGTLFGNDAGEDELPELLAAYFVDQPSFSPFFSHDNAFRIARSRKGMGKSAMLSKLAYDLQRLPSPPIVIHTTGADLLGIAQPEGTMYLAVQNYWKSVLCSRVNIELGRQIGFAFSDTAISLVQNAEITGFKERNIVGSLISRIRSSKIPIEITSPPFGNHEEVLKRAFSEFSDKKVWLLIDDIDATFIKTDDQVALISTFFSACRALVREVKGLSIRVSVRTDVWTSLIKNEDLDKCEQYITDISWSRDDLKAILSKKIYSYLTRTYTNFAFSAEEDYREKADKYIEWAFSRRIRWGNSHVPPFTAVRMLSAGRPRWMSQLCRLSGQAAVTHNRTVIGVQEINTVMRTRFTRLRLDDLFKEHSHQFIDLEKLVETFSGSVTKFTTQELIRELQNKYVKPVGHNNIPQIDGYDYKQIIQLAHFLYKIGFISARQYSADKSQGGEFVVYEQRPELLKNLTNPDDGMPWEIYPSYRALNPLKDGGSTP